MARGAGMQHVELDDEVAASVLPDGEAPPRTAHRRLWWLVPSAGAVVVLALVTFQGVSDARERASLARLADVPGVLEPIDPELPIRWEVDGPEAEAASYGALADGLSMNLIVDPDGSQRVVAIDVATGAERWSTLVYGPNAGLAEARATEGGSQSGYCVPVEPDVGEPASLACVVSDGYQKYGEGTYFEEPATETFVRILDVQDGHVLTQWPTGANGVGVSNGRIVAASWTEDGSIEVTARDPASGATLWTRQLDGPVNETDREHGPWIQGVGDRIELSSGNWSVRLDEDGTPLPVQPEIDGTSGGSWLIGEADGRLLSVSYGSEGSNGVQLLEADGSVAHTFPGELVGPSVDDGSVPNLILTIPARSDGGGGGEDELPPGSIRGSDSATGRTLWTADVGTSGYGALVLLGRVYVLAGPGIVVLDGRSGDVLWTVDPPDHVLYDSLMTDGRHLLALASPGQVGGDRIDAYRLTSGEQLWSAPIPAGLTEVHQNGGVLLGAEYAESEFTRTAVRVARLG